jgi:Domain of Unknown Function (DUF349)
MEPEKEAQQLNEEKLRQRPGKPKNGGSGDPNTEKPKKDNASDKEETDGIDSKSKSAEGKKSKSHLIKSNNPSQKEKDKIPSEAISDEGKKPITENDNPSKKTLGEEGHEKDPKGKPENEDHHEEYEFHEDDLHHEEDVRFEDLTKEELLEKIREYSGSPIESIRDKAINEIHKYFYNHIEEDKERALKEFVAGGNSKQDFEFRSDNEIISQFEDYYRGFKEKRKQFLGSQEKVKVSNVELKEELLEKLRKMVDGEVENFSIKVLKEIESEWRGAEPVLSSRARELWANFNALRDRFYDQRSIFFELKDLDRKKNQNLKEELIEKAKQLLSKESMQNAVAELKKLHDEYKHIGPVPKEVRTRLWDSFKGVSDQIHDKRREVSEEFKKVLEANHSRKEELIRKLKEMQNFTSDRINDWNAKTREVLSIQEEWKKAGPTPKSGAREISREFWSNFKGFFKLKQDFFKEIDKKRNENFELKVKLCEEVESLKDHEDWEKTAIRIKEIQRNWREIGPVPRKNSEEIYQRFKKSCDEFFQRRRELMEEKVEEFKENLQKKNEVCNQLEIIGTIGEGNLIEVQRLVKEWIGIGFVEREEIRNSRKRLKESLGKLLEKLDKESEEFKDFSFRIEAMLVQAGAGGGVRALKGKLEGFKRQIFSLQRETENWKQNVEMFSRSEGARKLKEQVEERIRTAEEKIKSLRDKIKILGD